MHLNFISLIVWTVRGVYYFILRQLTRAFLCFYTCVKSILFCSFWIVCTVFYVEM